MILYMYIVPGQGQTIPWRQNFDVNRISLSFCPFVASLKKISLKSDFNCFYVCVFVTCIKPQVGEKNFMTTERPFLFVHMLQVSK